MEINKPMTTRNMLASTLTDYKKPVKLPKITVELDPMLKKRFKAEAVRRGTTIRDMLTAWIEHDCPPLDVDQDWLPHTADAQPGRDERLLDIARETLQSNAGIPADQ